MSLHKSTVAIGRAHTVSVAPRRTTGSAKRRLSRTVFYAGVGSAKLIVAQLRSIGATPFGSGKEKVKGVYAVQRRLFSSSAKTSAASRGVSSTAALALAQYRDTAASRALKAKRPSVAVTALADTLQRLTSSAAKLNHGQPTSIAPVGVRTQRVMRSADMGRGSPRFDAAAASFQNEAESIQPNQVPRSANFQREISDFLDRQARLPPNGGPGFDRRLTPAWSGLKLPC